MRTYIFQLLLFQTANNPTEDDYVTINKEDVWGEERPMKKGWSLFR